MYLFTETGDSNEHTEWQANYMADDVIYITTWGMSKPGKHLCLGLGLSCDRGSGCTVQAESVIHAEPAGYPSRCCGRDIEHCPESRRRM